MLRAKIGASITLTVSAAPYTSDVVSTNLLRASDGSQPAYSYFCAHVDHRATRYATLAALQAVHSSSDTGDHVCGRFADGLVVADSPRGTGTIANLLTTLD